MSVSLRENITAVIETCFSETKDEIQDTAINRILELIRADRKTEPSDSEKPNNCETCIWSVCNYNKVPWDTDCNGCKFVGTTYDTEFPCVNCSRKTKDYYTNDEQLDKDTNVRSKDCETCLYRDYPRDTPICDSCTTANNHYENDLSEDEFKDIFKGFDREALILLIKNQRERISKLQSKVEGNPHIDDLIKQADSLIEFEKELLKTEPQTEREGE